MLSQHNEAKELKVKLRKLSLRRPSSYDDPSDLLEFGSAVGKDVLSSLHFTQARRKSCECPCSLYIYLADFQCCNYFALLVEIGAALDSTGLCIYVFKFRHDHWSCKQSIPS